MTEPVLPPDLLSAQGKPEQDFTGLLKALQAEMTRPLLQSPRAQLAAGLAGFASGYRGQPNPVLERAEASRNASLHQMIQMADLRFRVQAQQRAQDQALLGVAKDLLPLGGVPTETGAKIIGTFLTKSGYRVPGLEAGLAQGKFSLDSLEKIQVAKARNIPLDFVIPAYPTIPPAVIKSIYDTPLSDDVRKALKLPTQTEQNKEARELDIKNLEVLRKDLEILAKKREIEFPEIFDKKLGSLIIFQHLKNTQSPSHPGGLDYWEGTPQTRLKAQKDAFEAYRVQEIARAAALAGARVGELMVDAPKGGTIFDRKTRQYISQYKHTEGELDRTRFVTFNPTEKVNSDLVKRAMLQNTRLKFLTPKILAAIPGRNLAQAIKLGIQKPTGSNPMLREWISLVTDTEFENARVLSGAGQLRTLIVKLIEKNIAPSQLDTIKTALTAIDAQNLTMENFLRGLHHDPLLSHDRRIGPGTYWAIDRTTNQRVPIDVPEGKISHPRFLILEVR